MKTTKKITALILAVLMSFSMISLSASAESQVDADIKSDFFAIVESIVPKMSDGLKEFLTDVYNIFNLIAPNLAKGKNVRVADFKLENGYDSDNAFKVTYKITGSSLPYRSFKTNIVTTYEYRTHKGDGNWTEWESVKNSAGIPVIYSRFNWGMVQNAETGKKYNENFIVMENIPENTVVTYAPYKQDMASIANLAAGTEYAVRVSVKVCNSNMTTAFTSGPYTFTKA